MLILEPVITRDDFIAFLSTIDQLVMVLSVLIQNQSKMPTAGLSP